MYDPEIGKGARHDPDGGIRAFHDLHQTGCFVIPNPWDAVGADDGGAGGKGAGHLLGGPCLYAGAGWTWRHVSRDEALAHAETDRRRHRLPVSGDFENGFADDPDGVAETVRLAAEAGLSGCSIEDTHADRGNARL